MAVTTPTPCGNNTPATGTSTTVALTTTVAIPTGGKFIGKVGWNGSTTISGIACTTELSAQGGTLAAAGTNGTNHIQLVYLDCPYGLPSGSVITVTFSAASDSRHFAGNYVEGAAAGVGSGGATNSGTTAAWSTAAGTVNSGDLSYTAAYLAIDSTNTATSPFTELTEQKISTDSGSVDEYAAGSGSSITPAGTWGTSGTGWCSTSCTIGQGSIPVVGPQPRTVAESVTSTAGTSHTVTLPSGIAAGDLIIVCADKGSTAATINALTGWTELLDENSANGLYIAYRLADGSEGASITLTSSASTRLARIVLRLSNAQDPATQAPQIGTTATGTSVSPDPPSVTPTGGAKDYLAIAFFGDAGEEADDDTWANTPPTGYSPIPPFQKTGGTVGTNLGAIIALAYKNFNASSEDPGTFNQDASLAWRAQTIIVHPAPAGGTANNLTADPGSYAITGVATTSVKAMNVTADPATYVVTGQAATLPLGHLLSANPGSYAIVGSDVTLPLARILTTSPGAYVIAGQPATLNIGRSFTADPGAYLLTGAAAALNLGHELQANPGAYVLTGAPTSLSVARVLSADPGTYVISGADATLTVVTGGGVAYTLTVDPGTYSISGQDATLPVGRIISATPGTYTIAGFAAELPIGRVITASPGVYAVNGVDLAAVVARILSANPGAYIVQGANATLQGPAAPSGPSRPRVIVFKRFGIY